MSSAPDDRQNGLQCIRAFSGFSVRDPAEALVFYTEVLGLEVEDRDGMLTLRLPGGTSVLAYPKGDQHVPADFTVLNFTVADVAIAVRELVTRGVTFERYDGMDQDADGVMRGHGPDIAWFKDPSGNVFSVLAD